MPLPSLVLYLPPDPRYFLLAQHPGEPVSAHQGSHLSQRCCNLVWPRSGSCLLSWAHHLRRQQRPVQQGLQRAADRVVQEHAAAGLRVQRLLRRAESLARNASSGGSGGGTSSSSSSTGVADLVVQAELEVRHQGLMPCGGPVFVQLTTVAALVSPTSKPASATSACWLEQQTAVAARQGGESAAAAAALAGNKRNASSADSKATVEDHAAELQQYEAAAVPLAMLLLGETGAAGDGAEAAGSGDGSGHHTRALLRSVLKPATAEDALLHARQPPLRAFEAPPAGGDGGAAGPKARPFAWLEPLDVVPPAAQPAVAVLHINKMSQHLALRVSCDQPSGGGCRACASAGGGTCRSPTCVTRVERCLRGFCAEENGCVVAVDAHLHAGRLDATWALFVAGLQSRGRLALLAAVRRHFA